MTAPTLQPGARPVAPVPLFENIPQELRDRPQWVVWRYEERTRCDGSIYYTKVPYVPGDVRKARSNRPSTWRSFADAVAAYEQNPVGLDGIGYVFSKNDPYVGGDQDHDLSTDRIPLTYAEISPSDSGIKFIARASGTYGRHTARGELYSHGRFFTITGRVLDQAHAQITDQQAAVEAFAAALGTGRAGRSAGTANGNRAALAAAIERAIWDEANELWRTQRDRLLRREQAAAGREDTQHAILLRGDYAEYHRRWPGRNLYRADGSLDDSQVRFWHGCCLYGRGFTLAEYIALMHIHFGKDALAKWGTVDLWKQELAAMWDKYPDYTAYTPRQRQAPTPEPTYIVPSAPRGRAGDHAALVEQVYRLLRDYRIGVDALVKTGELATSIGVHRRTVITILNELRDAGRIATRTLARHGGLIVSFLGVIDAPVPAETAPDRPGTACNLGVIYSDPPIADLPIPAPQIDVSGRAAHEETNSSCVSSEHAPDHSSPADLDLAAWWAAQLLVPDADWGSLDDRRALRDDLLAAGQATAAWWVWQPVADQEQLPAPSSLGDVVAEALVSLPRERPNRTTGEIKRWPRSRGRIIGFVEAHYPALGFTDAQLDTAIEDARRAEKLADLATMTPGTLSAQIRMAERLAEKDRATGGNAWRWWSFFADKARQELASRPVDPKRPKGWKINPPKRPKDGYQPCEAKPNPRDVAAALQAAMWGVVDDDRASRAPIAPVGRAVKVESGAVDYAVVAAGIAARLARKTIGVLDHD